MSNVFKVKVIYTGGKTLVLEKSFEAIVEHILTADYLKDLYPLKLQFCGTGLYLYFDLDLFRSFHSGELHYAELIEETSCEELYRNWLEVEIEQSGEVIEPGALWKLKNGILILIDKDNFVTSTLDNKGFELVT